MKYVVIERHRSDNEAPLEIGKGTRVKVGRSSNGSEEWPNWIYCYSLDGRGEGWTPEQVIQTEGEVGVVLEDYSAKELRVEKGEIVEGYRELNGWVWCSKLKGAAEGWLPKEKIMCINAPQ